ncbi:uncharacterized protein DC041_0009210 [Schistosoma bovis]|uniref:Uncharacterized protein n=1 Tax=Schistosoma bovis TaxID=6184 RepID=A0A430QSJ5_SCHBO|nr:uncharacterized protein DC041_0009210 [Schistosoma bovis]
MFSVCLFFIVLCPFLIFFLIQFAFIFYCYCYNYLVSYIVFNGFFLRKKLFCNMHVSMFVYTCQHVNVENSDGVYCGPILLIFTVLISRHIIY